MKIKFKSQPYQALAVDAVVDCFDGQPPEVRQQIGQNRIVQCLDLRFFNDLPLGRVSFQLTSVVTRRHYIELANIAFPDLSLVQCIRASQSRAVAAIYNW